MTEPHDPLSPSPPTSIRTNSSATLLAPSASSSSFAIPLPFPTTTIPHINNAELPLSHGTTIRSGSSPSSSPKSASSHPPLSPPLQSFRSYPSSSTSNSNASSGFGSNSMGVGTKGGGMTSPRFYPLNTQSQGGEVEGMGMEGGGGGVGRADWAVISGSGMGTGAGAGDRSWFDLVDERERDEVEYAMSGRGQAAKAARQQQQQHQLHYGEGEEDDIFTSAQSSSYYPPSSIPASTSTSTYHHQSSQPNSFYSTLLPSSQSQSQTQPVPPPQLPSSRDVSLVLGYDPLLSPIPTSSNHSGSFISTSASASTSTTLPPISAATTRSSTSTSSLDGYGSSPPTGNVGLGFATPASGRLQMPGGGGGQQGQGQGQLFSPLSPLVEPFSPSLGAGVGSWNKSSIAPTSPLLDSNQQQQRFQFPPSSSQSQSFPPSRTPQDSSYDFPPPLPPPSSSSTRSQAYSLPPIRQQPPLNSQQQQQQQTQYVRASYSTSTPSLPQNQAFQGPPPLPHQSLLSGGGGGVGGGVGDEEISTIFVVGFPEDMLEREFVNMFTFSHGFEGATLKIPVGSISGEQREMNVREREEETYVGSGGGGGGGVGFNYLQVDLNGPYPGLSIPREGSPSTSTSASNATSNTLSIGSSSTGPGPAQGIGGTKKQIIGFARFNTRTQALEAREVLNGRKVDLERGSLLKAEMAKKNLHMGGAGAGGSVTGSGSGSLKREEMAGSSSAMMMMPSGVTGGPGGGSGRLNPVLLAELGRQNAINSLSNGASIPMGYEGGGGREREYSNSGSTSLGTPTRQPLPQGGQHVREFYDEVLTSPTFGSSPQLPPPHFTSNPSSNNRSYTRAPLPSDHPASPPTSPYVPYPNSNDLGSPSPIISTSTKMGNLSISTKSPASSTLGMGIGGGMGLGLSNNANGGIPRTQNPADMNAPKNTLYVGGLPAVLPSLTGPFSAAHLEDSLRNAFSHTQGFRRLCFRSKSGSYLVFVEYDDVIFATKALQEMYGHTLNGLVKGGIRLSYSKNPLGVRSAPMPNGGAGSPLTMSEPHFDFFNTAGSVNSSPYLGTLSPQPVQHQQMYNASMDYPPSQSHLQRLQPPLAPPHQQSQQYQSQQHQQQQQQHQQQQAFSPFN